MCLIQNGKFTIFLNDRKVLIQYNAVSKEIINRMMKIIRDRYTVKSYQRLGSPYDCDSEKNIIKEIRYINLLDEMRADKETFDITVIQPSVMLQRMNRGIIQKALQFLNSERLLGSLHLANQSEILVISRGKPFKTRWDVVPSHSHSHLYIPIEKLQSILFQKDDCFDNLQKLSMKTNNYTFLFYFDDSNKESQDYYRNLIGLVIGWCRITGKPRQKHERIMPKKAFKPELRVVMCNLLHIVWLCVVMCEENTISRICRERVEMNG